MTLNKTQRVCEDEERNMKAARRVFQNLNRKLRKIFKDAIKPERSEDYYKTEKRVNYCWIRPKSRRSKLLRY